jgi:imidazolonepropionase-like amidohydrolase
MKPALLLALLVIDNVTIVDPAAERLSPASRVIIRAGRIEAVGPRANVRIPPGARRIDAAGQFLIPGLWDMHVHAGEIEPDWFPLYLANGVTGLREMAAQISISPGSAAIARN